MHVRFKILTQVESRVLTALQIKIWPCEFWSDYIANFLYKLTLSTYHVSVVCSSVSRRAAAATSLAQMYCV